MFVGLCKLQQRPVGTLGGNLKRIGHRALIGICREAHGDECRDVWGIEGYRGIWEAYRGVLGYKGLRVLLDIEICRYVWLPTIMSRFWRSPYLGVNWGLHGVPLFLIHGNSETLGVGVYVGVWISTLNPKPSW